MPVAANAGYTLVWRRGVTFECVFLAHEEYGRERIVAWLEVPEHGQDEAVSLFCRSVGKPPGVWGDAVGLVANERTAAAYQPTRAWVVDFAVPRFEEISPSAVKCDAFGVD